MLKITYVLGLSLAISANLYAADRSLSVRDSTYEKLYGPTAERMSSQNGLIGNIIPSYSQLPLDPALKINTVDFSLDIERPRLTCSGITLGDVAANLTSEMKQMGEYYSKNALSLAVNYLVYTQPPLYQNIMDMLDGFRVSYSDLMLSCNSVRSMGRTELEKKAQKACLDSKKDPKLCVDLENYSVGEEEMVNAVKNLKAFLESAKAKTVLGSGNGRVPGVPSQSCKGEGEVAANLNNAIIVAGEFNKKDQDIISSILPGVSVCKGQASTNLRKDPPNEAVVKAQKKHGDIIEDAVESYLNGDDDKDSKLKEINLTQNAPPYSQSTIQQLGILRRSDPNGYLGVVSQLSRMMALDEMERLVDRYEIAYLNVMTDKVTSLAGTETSNIEGLSEKQIKYIRAYLESERRSDERKLKQQEVLKAVKRYNDINARRNRR